MGFRIILFKYLTNDSALNNNHFLNECWLLFAICYELIKFIFIRHRKLSPCDFECQITIMVEMTFTCYGTCHIIETQLLRECCHKHIRNGMTMLKY